MCILCLRLMDNWYPRDKAHVCFVRSGDHPRGSVRSISLRLSREGESIIKLRTISVLVPIEILKGTTNLARKSLPYTQRDDPIAHAKRNPILRLNRQSAYFSHVCSFTILASLLRHLCHRHALRASRHHRLWIATAWCAAHGLLVASEMLGLAGELLVVLWTSVAHWRNCVGGQ